MIGVNNDIINDINDVEKDRKHEVKRNRPLASGAISIKNAKILLIFMIALNIIAVSCDYYLYNKIYNSTNIFI